MAFGLGRLGLAPSDFWTATPREIAAALRVRAGPQRGVPPTRADLAALMQSFPDR